jgi:Fe-S cluster assembly iron-binding protein IscA
MPDSKVEKKTAAPILDLRGNLNKVASAFFLDEKLQRIITGPLLLPPNLNVINTLFSGPMALDTETSTVLNDLISKYIPPEIDRESVLTTEAVLSLRKLSLLTRLAGELHRQPGLNLAKTLTDTDSMLSQSKLDALVSSEEMYRIRNYQMDPNVANFPETIIASNPQLKLEPAYDSFVRNIKTGMKLEEVAMQIKSTYNHEHTAVTFEPAKISGLKPLFGMNGV